VITLTTTQKNLNKLDTSHEPPFFFSFNWIVIKVFYKSLLFGYYYSCHYLKDYGWLQYSDIYITKKNKVLTYKIVKTNIVEPFFKIKYYIIIK